MNNPDEADYFTDPTFVANPYPFFKHLRDGGAVRRMPTRDVIAVTGYEELIPVYNDGETFSSIVSTTGPIPPLPFKPEGDDITAQIELSREKVPYGKLVGAMDGERHAANRLMLARLFTPSRLRDNEAYMARIADEHIDRFIGRGTCEFYSEYSHSFSALVIADLLGVPQEDRKLFADKRKANAPASPLDQNAPPPDFHQFAARYFTKYIRDREQSPRNDIMTEFVTTKLPDGSKLSHEEIVNLAVMIFGGGQGTSAHLMATSMRIIGENPDLQQKLRDNRDLIPDFIEETLRFDGPVKNTFRIARKATTISGVDVPIGTCVMLGNGASNHDPRQYNNPDEFQMSRPNIRHHLAFGRGAHTCPGAALARAEARISINRLLERLRDIKISVSKHGPPSARKYDYEQSYILRGLNSLYLEFEAAQR